MLRTGVLSVITVSLTCLPGAGLAAIPGTTTFTYQGQLKQSGVPVNDTCDVSAELWNAESNGASVAGPQVVADIEVVQGLFAIDLDFGADPFVGAPPWLEIAVRCPAGGGNFVTLAPRQAITAAPYAVQTRGINVDDSGNVGVGTTAPQAGLHVKGIGGVLDLEGTGHQLYMQFYPDGFAAGPKAEIGWSGATTPDLRIANWITGGDMLLTTTGTNGNVIVPNGNVGIGTSNPSERLTVAGGRIYPAGTGTNSGIQFAHLALFEDTDATLKLTSAGGYNVALMQDGKVGIGTTAPKQKLDIEGHVSLLGSIIGRGTWLDIFTDTADGADTKGTRIGGGGDVINSRGAYATFYGNEHASSPGDIYLTPGGGGKTIVTNGNVGIGTTSPQAKLDVAGTARIRALGDSLVIQPNQMTAYQRSRIVFSDPDGGTTPMSLEYVDDGSPDLVIYGGNVGIGVADPQERLVVDGYVKCTAIMWPDGSIFSGGGSQGSGGVTSINGQGGPALQIRGAGGTTVSSANNVITVSSSGGSGGGVTSINGQTGPSVTLQAGSNVSISQANNEITISAAGGSGSGGIQRIKAEAGDSVGADGPDVVFHGAGQAHITRNGDTITIDVPQILCTFGGRTYSTGAKCSDVPSTCFAPFTILECQANGSWQSQTGTNCNNRPVTCGQ